MMTTTVCIGITALIVSENLKNKKLNEYMNTAHIFI